MAHSDNYRAPLVVAAVIGLTFAALLTALRATQPGPPGVGHPGGDAVSGLAGFFAVYASPALLALVGIARDARAPLLAAALVSLPLAVTAFSGITFVLLVPGLLYLGAALGPGGLTRGATAFALVAAALAIGAAVSLFALTEAGCWVQRPDGSVAAGAPGDTQALDDDVISAGCGSGLLSDRAGLVALTLVLGALAAAEVATRLRRSAGSRSRSV